MSVINKMLRDLDARRTAPVAGHGASSLSGAWPGDWASPSSGHGSGAQTLALRARMTLQGTLAQAAPLLSQRPVWLMGLGLLCALVALVFHWPGSSDRILHWSLETPPQVSSVAPPAQTAQSVVVEPQEEVLEATRTHGRPPWPMSSALMLKLSASLPMTLPVSMTRETRTSEPVASVPQSTTALTSALAPAGATAPEVSMPSGAGPTTSPTPAVPPYAQASVASGPSGQASSSGPSAPIQVNRQPAMQENLQQAQQLWHAGSREAAHELLRSTLQAAEQGDMGAADAQAVLREWARMALAQDRAAEVMAVIKRHATHLAQQPETWALKGQAAQRLGLHAEAIDAYTHALSLRPHEVRWLLASAVSMAAAGQTEQAARLVAKARAQGPINPQVMAYLKQAGVAVP